MSETANPAAYGWGDFFGTVENIFVAKYQAQQTPTHTATPETTYDKTKQQQGFANPDNPSWLKSNGGKVALGVALVVAAIFVIPKIKG